VVKGNGQREPFDRDKLVRSMQVALRKRPVDADRLERRVRIGGDPDVPGAADDSSGTVVADPVSPAHRDREPAV